MKTVREQGFTLHELIVVVILISILACIALPNLTDLVESTRSEAEKELLLSHLQGARSHAITQARAVVLCGSSQGLSCDGSWESGWLVREQGDSQPLNVHRSQSARVSWRGFSPEIVFLPNGTSPASNGRFEICSRDGEHRGSVILNRQGRARSENANQNTSQSPCRTGYP